MDCFLLDVQNLSTHCIRLQEIMIDEEEIEECDKLINDYILDNNSELNLPVSRYKIKCCFNLMKNAVDRIKIGKEDKSTITENNFMYDCVFRSLDTIDRKTNHLKDKKICILFQTFVIIICRITGKNRV